jgi:sugar lactone lactonase YvrE
LQSAYKLPSSSAGAGKTIAIVDAFDDPNAQADLNVYRSTYGLPPCEAGCFTKVNQEGGTSYPKANAGWALEISLDLDMASAACPKCKLLLVEANDNSLVNLGIAVNQAAKLGATVISNSYAAREIEVGKTQLEEDSVYYNHPGIPQTVGSGDWGYNNENTSYTPCLNCSPSFPAGLNTVIAVGGTDLRPEGETGRGWTESVWQFSGSGCTLYVAKPSWQTDKGCANRTDNDIAAVAGTATPVSVYDTYGLGAPGWQNVGGTSASAPLVAGAIALNPTLTSEGVEGIYKNPTNWYDVKTGSNWLHIGACKETYLCFGGAGFDGPTGLGTPNGGAISTPPGAVTEAASNVTTTGATINGMVNAEASPTTYYFQYGHTKLYGKEVPKGGAAVSGYTKPMTVSQALSGLDPASIYHYRVVASSAGGTTFGADKTFSTAPKVPLSTISSKGTAEGKLETPWGTATDASGNIWVTDFVNNRIQEFSPSGTLLRACGSTGSGNAQFKGPTGIAVNPIGGLDHEGYIYVSDSGNNRIEVFTPECKFVEAFGTAGSGNGQLLAPMGLAFGQVTSIHHWKQPYVLLVADSGNHRVEVFNWAFDGETGTRNNFVTTYGTKGTGNGQFDTPIAIVRGGREAARSEYFYVVDYGNNRVQKIEEKEISGENPSLSYAYLSQFGSKGSGNGQFSSPAGITLDPTTGDLLVTDLLNNRVEEFLPSGTYVAQFGTKGSGSTAFDGPIGISVDSAGKVYVADATNSRIAVWQSAPTYPPEWVVTPTPTPSETKYSWLNGVSCPVSTTVCTAVGEDSPYNKPVAERWNGAEWSPQTMPIPAGSGSNPIIFNDVSCPSSSLCEAVGNYKPNATGVPRALIEVWNGTEWKLQTAPEVAGALSTELTGVSCTSASACTVVGNYKSSAGVIGSLAERWNGTEWKIQTTPNPAGAKETKATGVSCASATACTMIGVYANSAGGVTMPFAEGWNGTTWSTQTLPSPPAGLKASGAGGVSCTAATACTMVGGYLTEPPLNLTRLILRWNGTEWKSQTPGVLPAGTSFGNLAGVSCVSATVCTAVGSKMESSQTRPLAERWNGTEWSVQSTPNGPFYGGGPLSGGVSCPSTSSCAAVGSDGGTSFAEIYG